MIVCVLLPRFALVVAAGGRGDLLREPAALAPEAGAEQRVGEVSPAAEAFGVHPGMPMGEALARCPRLALVPPDPLGVADAWEHALQQVESIGAQVEDGGGGLACFAADGLRRLHGGGLDGVLGATRCALRDGSFTAAGRLGAGPARFTAQAAAISRARVRRPAVIADPQALWPEPVALLRRRAETEPLPDALECLGVDTLGALAALPRDALADRFGPPGLLAHDLVHGRDTPLRPRVPGEQLEETLDLPEAGSGVQLERALTLLVDRLLARRERRGRTLRVVVLAATLVEGGTWRERVVLREPMADGGRMRMALGLRLALLPAPAQSLRLTAERFGPVATPGQALFDDDAVVRRRRLREAVRQVRATAGPDGALRAVTVDPDSRIPERRTMLTPFDP
jgi:protein ImuB